MRFTAKPLILLLSYLTCGVIAFWAVRSDDPVREVMGAIVLVLLLGWAIAALFRGRRRVIR